MTDRSVPASPLLNPPLPIATYINMFRARCSAEELILDFGLDAHQRTDHSTKVVVLLHRLVLTWNNAKHLALMLHDLIYYQEMTHAPLAPRSANRTK